MNPTLAVMIDPDLPIAKTAKRPYEVPDNWSITKYDVADYCGIPVKDYDFFVEEMKFGRGVPSGTYHLIKLGGLYGHIHNGAIRSIHVKPKARRRLFPFGRRHDRASL